MSQQGGLPQPVTHDRSSAAALAGAIERLGQVVEAESAALLARTQVDLTDFANRKSRGLLELTRLMQTQDLAAAVPSVRELAEELSDKLETNRALLKTHLHAVQELAAIIAGTMREAESDGTYSVAAQRAANAA